MKGYSSQSDRDIDLEELQSKRSYGSTADSIPEKLPWKQRFFPTGFKYELKNILSVAIPVIFTNMFQFIIPTESITMCGHLSKLELDGVALANSMINAFGLSIGTGLCTACDTLFAQAYGSNNKKRTGMFLQRSIMVISLAPFLLWSVYINAEPIFIALGQDPEVARLAAHYMRLFLPGFMFHFNYLILARYMQNQDHVYPPMVIGALGNVFNIATQYTAIYVIGYGYEASALLQASTFFVMWLAELIYILVTRLYEDTWDGWAVEALFDWGHFLKLAIAGVGHVTLEEMGWEICVLLAGIMGATELATQSILLQAEVFTYMLPLGIGVALNIRVGQYLGGNNPQGAKTCLHVGLCIIAVTSTVLAVIFISCKDVIPYIFTYDADVVRMASMLLPFMAVLIYTDNISGACGGVLRGCGKQKIGAIISLVGYYFFGFPLAVILAFVAKLDLVGILVGMSLGLIFCTVSLVIVLARMSWQEQALEAQQRMQSRHATMTDETFSDTTPIISAIPSHMTTKGHVRTPSQPYTCSTEVPKLPPGRVQISSEEVIAVVKKRLLTLLGLILVFVSFSMIHAFLPREAYWPHPPLNVTDPETVDPLVNVTLLGDLM